MKVQPETAGFVSVLRCIPLWIPQHHVVKSNDSHHSPNPVVPLRLLVHPPIYPLVTGRVRAGVVHNAEEAAGGPQGAAGSPPGATMTLSGPTMISNGPTMI